MISSNPIVGFSAVHKSKKSNKDIDFTDCIPDYPNVEKEIDNERRSRTRTKQAIYDIAFNNAWEYFITVTFDSSKVDRYNYDEVRKKYIIMLSNLKQRKYPNLQYIFVPELHKDGAVHFHGLLCNADELELIDSGKKDRRNRKIFNAPDFKLGFNTLTKICDPAKAATYLSKYITKETHALQGKKYWNSTGLNQLQVDKYFIGDDEIKKELKTQLIESADFAGLHTSKIETSSYCNAFEYILTQKACK
jgi:hypothetical protein